MRKNIIVLLLIVAFLLMYLPIPGIGNIGKIAGLIVIFGCAAAVIIEKKK